MSRLTKPLLFASPEECEQAFYEALDGGDGEAVVDLWLEDDDVICIHPGGPRMVGFAAVAIFVAAYLAVIAEEFTELRKSKPMMLAAGVIWALIAAFYAEAGQPEPRRRHSPRSRCSPRLRAGHARASSTASGAALCRTIRLALVTIPHRWAWTTPPLTPGLWPKSSALTTRMRRRVTSTDPGHRAASRAPPRP